MLRLDVFGLILDAEYGCRKTVFVSLREVWLTGEQPIRLPNGLLYPRVEVEQRTHSGDEIERHWVCTQVAPEMM